jgi:hypothetical protein
MYVAQAVRELVILLLQPLKCWDYRCALRRPASITEVLGKEACIMVPTCHGVL